ncbi:MAG TPA: alpha/beta fold hydrolase [Solirubrobacterales bacterium]|nr:alpha/beta fold hydrolase [Solirubrobacterales bacterium]
MRFVLVHGAFVGGWIWTPLAERLEEIGHSAETPDLPGSGSDPTPVDEVSLDAYTERICDPLDASAEPSILVANSMGGIVISQAAARRPEKVERLVYVAAFLPGDGQSLVDLTRLPEGADDLVQKTVVVSGDPPTGTLPESTRRASNEDCAPEVTDWAVRKTGSQAFAPLTEPASLGPAFEGIPRSYVICTRDRIVPPALQRRMVRDGRVTDVVELDAGHHPQLSRVEELALVLHRRAREEVAA